jgi:hypothetical protein
VVEKTEKAHSRMSEPVKRGEYEKKKGVKCHTPFLYRSPQICPKIAVFPTFREFKDFSPKISKIVKND